VRAGDADAGARAAQVGNDEATTVCTLEAVSWATQAVKSKQQTIPRGCTVYTIVQWSSGPPPCRPTRRTLAGDAIGSPADEGEGVACAGPCTHRQRLLELPEASDSGQELAASTIGDSIGAADCGSGW
jgi:hypothetical protein